MFLHQKQFTTYGLNKNVVLCVQLFCTCTIVRGILMYNHPGSSSHGCRLEDGSQQQKIAEFRIRIVWERLDSVLHFWIALFTSANPSSYFVTKYTEPPFFFLTSKLVRKFPRKRLILLLLFFLPPPWKILVNIGMFTSVKSVFYPVLVLFTICGSLFLKGNDGECKNLLLCRNASLL